MSLLAIQDGGPASTISVDIPNNSIVVVAHCGNKDTTSNIESTLTVSGGGYTWVPISSSERAVAFSMCGKLWYALVTTGGSGISLSLGGTSAMTSTLTTVWAETEYNTSDPLGGFIISATTSQTGAHSVTLNEAPTVASRTLAGVAHDGGTTGTMAITPGSDFTEAGEDGSTGNETFGQTQSREGTVSTSTSVSWVDAQTGTMTVASTIAWGVTINLDVGTTEQEGFRWRNDNGSETGATYRASQDANGTATLAEQLRLRMLLNSTGNNLSVSNLLEFKKSSEATALWRAIGIGAPGASPPTVVGWGSAALTTNDPSANLSSGSWTPAENDIVVLFVSSTTVLDLVVDASMPSGWYGALGSGVDVNSDAHGYCAMLHVVTAGEAGGSTTFTATNALAAAETGNVVGIAVRGADPTTPIHKAASGFDSGNTATPSVLTALTGANQPTISNCLVLRGVSQDSTGTYTTPAAHTSVALNNTNQVNQVFSRDAATTAGSDVAATNATPDAGDEYCAITLAFLPARGTAAITHATSSQYADGDATTGQLTSPSGKSGSDFQAGVMVETDSLANAIDLATSKYTEIEWALKAQSPAIVGDVYQFRVTANGIPITTYSVTPQLEVVSGSVLSQQIKVSGAFVTKPQQIKLAGTFVTKPHKIKVGGSFVP